MKKKRKKQQKTNKDRKEQEGTEAIVKGSELICNASLIFKSNLELALLIILK